MTFLRTVVAFLLAVAAAGIAASVISTQFVLAGLQSIGADIPAGVRLDTTLADLTGFAPVYSGVLAVGFLIAFLLAWRLKKLLPFLAPAAYPLAGAAAVAAALYAMSELLLGVPLIAGARSEAGFAAQCAAGAFGGLVYAILRPR